MSASSTLQALLPLLKEYGLHKFQSYYRTVTDQIRSTVVGFYILNVLAMAFVTITVFSILAVSTFWVAQYNGYIIDPGLKKAILGIGLSLSLIGVLGLCLIYYRIQKEKPVNTSKVDHTFQKIESYLNQYAVIEAAKSQNKDIEGRMKKMEEALTLIGEALQANIVQQSSDTPQPNQRNAKKGQKHYEGNTQQVFR